VIKRYLFIPWVLLFPAVVAAAGLTQHQFMADIASGLVTNPELAQCLGENRNAYLVGSSFPDCGYAALNDPLSEDAHTTEFIDAFVTHIRETYTYPFTDEYDAVSFMLGIASHVADDPPYHQYFIAEVAEQDFEGDYDRAHTMCDAGLEFLTIVDYSRWCDNPCLWLPLSDIVETFAAMGSSHSSRDIVFGNMILNLAGVAERTIALYLYLPVALMMPWGAANYYDYPMGGLFNGGEIAAEYYETIWEDLMAAVLRGERYSGNVPEGSPTMPVSRFFSGNVENRRILYDFARECLEKDIVRMAVIRLDDGSILVGQPRIRESETFDFLLRDAAESILLNLYSY
jgi:hypothetical protein